MSIYLGIDPGASGSMCFLNAANKEIEFLPTPGMFGSARQLKNEILSIDTNCKIKRAAIEDVHSLFGMSAASNFQFGYNVGAVTTLIEITGIGFELVTPKTWQKAVGLVQTKPPRKGKELKKAIADLALRLYPDAQILGPKGGLLDGRADALMIAHYLVLKYGGSK